MQEPAADDKYIRYPGKTNDFSNPIYDREYARSIDNRDEFWAQQANELVWSKKFTKVVDTTD